MIRTHVSTRPCERGPPNGMSSRFLRRGLRVRLRALPTARLPRGAMSESKSDLRDRFTASFHVVELRTSAVAHERRSLLRRAARFVSCFGSDSPSSTRDSLDARMSSSVATGRCRQGSRGARLKRPRFGLRARGADRARRFRQRPLSPPPPRGSRLRRCCSGPGSCSRRCQHRQRSRSRRCRRSVRPPLAPPKSSARTGSRPARSMSARARAPSAPLASRLRQRAPCSRPSRRERRTPTSRALLRRIRQFIHAVVDLRKCSTSDQGLRRPRSPAPVVRIPCPRAGAR